MDASAGAIYHQLVVFQNDPSQLELIFNDPSPENQLYIQTLVRGLGLEFEYSTITNSTRISRRSQILAQPAQDEFREFLDFEQAWPSDGELPDAYGFPPPAEVNWNELFSSQDEMDCDSLQQDGPMFASKSAFPELDLAPNSFDENQQYVAVASHDLHPDHSNAISITASQQEQQSLVAFDLDFHLRKTQDETELERFDNFQTPQSTIPSPITGAQSYIEAILSSLGISQYLHRFLEQGFDTWEAISGITENDFDTLGVKLGHRRKLQQFIANQKLAAEVHVGYSSVRLSDEKSTGTSQNDTELGQNLPPAGPILGTNFRMPKKLEGLNQTESAEITIMSAANEGQSSGSRRNASKSESLSSCASSTGRSRISKAFSRKGSTREETYPGYQVWDSRSANSASSSIDSVSSTGRRGLLSNASRAMTNAVKAAKACWRCKFIRKPCDLELPCKSCPKGKIKGRDNSAWLQLGCKRGDLKDEMPKIKLCQQIAIDKDAVEVVQQVNEGSRRAIQRRQEALTEALTGNISLLCFDFELELFVQSLEPFHTNCKQKSVAENSTLQVLLPLHECLFFIAWECHHCPKSRSILGARHTMLEQLVVLRSAANYQAIYEDDKLIALSLICLRTCLEALGVTPAGVQSSSHRACDPEQCKVECIRNLESCLEMYLNELSRVFFKQSNLRSKSWWLSAFYSFCIHSIVRRGLIILVNIRHEYSIVMSSLSVVKNYLIIALRFFVATSGIYDPLTKSTNLPESITSETKLSLETDSDKHFKAAREAVKQETWTATGISGSMQYLQNLFQDHGQCLLSMQTNSASSEKDKSGLLECSKPCARPMRLRSVEQYEKLKKNRRALVDVPAPTSPKLRLGLRLGIGASATNYSLSFEESKTYSRTESM